MSENKGTGKTSVVDATSTLPSISAIAIKPSTNDALMEAFEKHGKCLKCYAKVRKEGMVLCQCGHFTCRDCFLAGCCCSEERDDAGKERKKNTDYFITVGSTSQEIDLEGKTFQLECLFTNPIPM